MGERLRERIKEILIKKAHLRGFGLDDYDEDNYMDDIIMDEQGGLLKGSTKKMYEHYKELADKRIKNKTLEKSKKNKYIHNLVLKAVKRQQEAKKGKKLKTKRTGTGNGSVLKEYNKEVSLFMDLNPRYTREEARKIVSKEWKKNKK